MGETLFDQKMNQLAIILHVRTKVYNFGRVPNKLRHS